MAIKMRFKQGSALTVMVVSLVCVTPLSGTALVFDEEPVSTAPLSASHQEAKALMEKDDFKAAIKVLKAAVENGEDSFQTHQLLVRAYGSRIDQVGMLKKRGLAIKLRESMERSLALNPDSEEARSDLIGFHIQAPGMVGGNKDKARELIDGHKGLSEAERYVYHARVSRAEKDTDGALAYLEKSLAADKNSASAYILKTNMQFEQEAYGEAFKTAQSCVHVKPENMSCQYVLGKAAHVGNIETETGITALKTFIAAGGHNEGFTAHAHYRLGELQARNGDITSAKASLQKAIDVNGLEIAKEALKKLQG